MRPRLYPTPFSRLWHPVMARVYGGLMPSGLDELTHGQFGRLMDDLELVSR